MGVWQCVGRGVANMLTFELDPIALAHGTGIS